MPQPTFQSPQIDYLSHPYYADIRAELGPEQREATVSQFYTIFSQMIAAQARLKQYVIQHPVERNGSSEVAELDRAGILSMSLDESDHRTMSELIRPLENELVERRGRKAAEKRAVGAVSLQVARQAEPSRELQFFNDLLAKYGIFDLCRAHKGVPYTLKVVMLQHNSNEDAGLAKVCSFEDGTRAKSYYTHIDSPVDAMKAIIYVTPDVTPEGGAFRYYPGSYATWTPLELAIRKTNDKCGWEATSSREIRAQFAALPPDLQKKANFGNDILDDGLADEILTHEQVYDTSRGNLLLFDPDGAHRGAIFSEEAERKILQLSLIPALS